MEIAQPNIAKPFTGRHMALIMVTFFAVVVGVNVTMAVLARRSWTGLLVQNAYVASQHFNADVAKREAMLATGNKLSLNVANGLLTVMLIDRFDQPLEIRNGKFILNRVTDPDAIAEYELSCTGTRCDVPITLAPGLWRGEANLQTVGRGAWLQPVEIFVKGP